MDWFTKIVTRIYSQVFFLVFVLCGLAASAQDYGKLTVDGSIVCDKKDKSIVSSVTIYRYYHQSESVELIEQQMIVRDGNFKFDAEFDKEYIIDVASNTGVHKRINLYTEVMKGYKFDNQRYQFAVNVQSGDMENPEEVAWIYFDPSKNDFAQSDQMPVAFQNR